MARRPAEEGLVRRPAGRPTAPRRDPRLPFRIDPRERAWSSPTPGRPNPYPGQIDPRRSPRRRSRFVPWLYRARGTVARPGVAGLERLDVAVRSVWRWRSPPSISRPAAAAPGDLDPTFGVRGKVKTPLGCHDEARRWSCSRTGSSWQRGIRPRPTRHFALARYNADGTLDGSFGTGGTVTTSIGDARTSPTRWSCSRTGSSWRRGTRSTTTRRGIRMTEVALVRYNADGSLDGTFGTGGTVATPIARIRATSPALVLQPDGRLVAAGAIPRTSRSPATTPTAPSTAPSAPAAR